MDTSTRQQPPHRTSRGPYSGTLYLAHEEPPPPMTLQRCIASKRTPPLQEPTVGLRLGPYGGPRVHFLLSEVRMYSTCRPPPSETIEGLAMVLR